LGVDASGQGSNCPEHLVLEGIRIRHAIPWMC
jgi:hypothetical protein